MRGIEGENGGGRQVGKVKGFEGRGYFDSRRYFDLERVPRSITT